MEPCNIGAGGHSCFFLEQLGKILGTVAAAHLLCYGLDLVISGGNQQLFCPFDANIREIVGKTGSGFLLELFC